MTPMRTHYLVLASCVVVIGFLGAAAWFTYQRNAFALTVTALILGVFAVLFTVDEWHIIRKKRNDRFKQPPLTTERG